MKVSNSFALSAAVAGLIAGSVSIATSNPAYAKADKVDCYNTCKGHALCAGKNKKTGASCAGTVDIKMPAKACEKKGGTTTKPEAPAAAAPATGGDAPKQ